AMTILIPTVSSTEVHMRFFASLGALVTLSASLSCHREVKMPEPLPLKTFGLHTVEGYSGGYALWVAADNTTILQVVTPPPIGKFQLWEKKYQFTISDGQRAEVERLAGVHHLLKLKPNDRLGSPGESTLIIHAVTMRGEVIRAKKWAN